MRGTAGEVTDDVEDGIATFSRVSLRQGLRAWDATRVTGDAHLRLYRATVTEHEIPDPSASIEVRIRVML